MMLYMEQREYMFIGEPTFEEMVLSLILKRLSSNFEKVECFCLGGF